MKFWRITYVLFFLMAVVISDIQGQSDSDGIIFLKEYASPLEKYENGCAYLASGDSVKISDQEEDNPKLIIWMNHADTDTIGLDPGLSFNGHKKADKLAHLFGPDDLNGVYITHYRRTYLTVQPLIEAVMPPVYRYEPGDQSFFAKKLLEGEKGVSLIVGHEKSLPVLTTYLLGGKDPGMQYSGHDYLIVGKVMEGRISELYKFNY